MLVDFYFCAFVCLVSFIFVVCFVFVKKHKRKYLAKMSIEPKFDERTADVRIFMTSMASEL